jgi:hypothetical protein
MPAGRRTAAGPAAASAQNSDSIFSASARTRLVFSQADQAASCALAASCGTSQALSSI